MALFGRVEVRVRNDDGQVLVGFGPVVWLRRFDGSQVESVRIAGPTASGEEQSKREIVIEDGKTIRFGGGLRDDRRKWMLAALRQLLTP